MSYYIQHEEHTVPSSRTLQGPRRACLSPSPPLNSHLLCDKFVDILVLRQEFLPAQAPIPPQLACGFLALQNRQSASAPHALHLQGGGYCSLAMPPP